MAIALGFAALAIVVWQSARWDDTGDGTCGPLYRPAIWWTTTVCRQRAEARLALVAAGLVLAVAAAGCGTRALLHEAADPTDRDSAATA